MSSFFEPRSSTDVWFSVGRVQVTSTLAVVILGTLGCLAWVFVPSLPLMLALIPEQVFSGEVWRLLTWPLAGSVDLWQLLMLVMLWLFGTQLENSIGRNNMAKLFLGIWAVLTACTVVVGLLLPGSTLLFGLRTVEFCILLLFIAENPRRPFFFGIPAWVIGAVFLGIEILQLVAARAGGTLLALLLSLAGVAILARRVGLLENWTMLPGPGRPARAPSRTRHRAATAPSAPASGRSSRHHTPDEDRLDELLGKISAHGIHSLTKSERSELEKIRERRRR